MNVVLVLSFRGIQSLLAVRVLRLHVLYYLITAARNVISKLVIKTE